MKNKILATAAGGFATVLFLISILREQYVETLVHVSCNQAIVGVFNKTKKAGKYVCTQDGKELHVVPYTENLIPSPAVLIAFYTVLALGFILYQNRKRDTE